MKCPKCQYISFDSPERCRNCGYDFGLAPAPVRPVDVTYRDTGAADGPMLDFSLGGSQVTPTAGGTVPSQAPVDLPLFDAPVPGLDDTPLISSPQPPRAPLSVRRTTPEASKIVKPQRSRVVRPTPPAAPGPLQPREPQPDLLEEAPRPPVPERRRGIGDGEDAAAADRAQAGPASVWPGAMPAPAGRRLLALLVDVALVALIDLAIVHFTLAVVAYPWSRLLELPLLPLVAFCVMLNAAYAVLFTTASGQTAGKVVAGLRVVSEGSLRVPVTQAAVRTALAPLSLLVVGLGYLPALVGPDRRALHDRLSNTRVVRA
jgi:uncharacterized RDD family membrane protein YckC